jgi:hypothetical protein
VDNMKTFVLWFLEQLPSFLLSEPMCYFVGFAFLVVTIRIIRDIIRF